MTDRPRKRPPPRRLAENDTALDDTVADETVADRTVADRTVADRTVADDTDDRTVVDDANERTVIDDTAEERTVIDPGAQRAAAEAAARRRARPDPPRPTPMSDDETETSIERPRPDDDSLPGIDDLLDVMRLLGALAAQVGRWLRRHVLRPAVHGTEIGLKALIHLFRPRRPEDSDAYSRRRGQQWRRFREGDQSINELKEFDQKFRKRPEEPPEE